MERTSRWVVAFLVTAVLAGLACAAKVRVPPRVDLRERGTVGLLDLSSNAGHELPRRASRELLAALQDAQPGLSVRELGAPADVLRSVERRQLDAEAARAIGERHEVDALLTGHLELAQLPSQRPLSAFVRASSARGEVSATLDARLIETASGVTLWAESAQGRATVADLELASAGRGDAASGDPRGAHSRLVRDLVEGITADFRERWERP